MVPFPRAVTLAILALSLASSVANAQTGDSMGGRTYALAHCTECHNVGAGRQQGPIRPGEAPDFAAVANARTTTALGLEVFLTTPHAKMPNFMIAEADRQNVAAYILRLRTKSGAPR